MIREEICTYEVAKLAKEKGFPQQHPNKNGECRIYALDKSKSTYVLCDWTLWMPAPWASKIIAAPTQSLLQRWLREEKNIDIAIVPLYTGDYSYIIYNIHCRDNRVVNTNAGYATYELALEDALTYALKNLG